MQDEEELFESKEIRQTETFLLFEKKKKIVTFVPVSHAEVLIKILSKSGAGQIGNYDMCSFRSKGTGTFKPNKKAKPFSGKKNVIASEEEFRLEMECGDDSINKVIDNLLQYHPYEEVANEIYEFVKREIKSSGVIYRLKRPFALSKILARINKEMFLENAVNNIDVKSIAITGKKLTAQVRDSAIFSGCDLIVRKSLKPKKFELLITKL